MVGRLGFEGAPLPDQDSLEVAQFCHDLAVVLNAAAELLCQHARTILASVPTGGPHDRNRVAWAVELAAEIESRGRREDAERVLLAALAVSEELFGRDDPQSVATRRLLDPSGLMARRDRAGGSAPAAGQEDGPSAGGSSPRRETPNFA
jgi:hypothetical protein